MKLEKTTLESTRGFGLGWTWTIPIKRVHIFAHKWYFAVKL